MDLIQCRVDAIARSIHIHTTEEAEGLVVAVAHLYRDGQLTWKALIAACRFLYGGYDVYRPATKANLLREARGILRLAETALTGS